MPTDGPTLRKAITESLRSGFARADDDWVRIDVPPDWPLGEAIGDLNIPALRVGVLTSHAALADDLPNALTDASVLTEDRNGTTTERRAKPTLLVGDATGTQESGLSRIYVTLREPEVFALWRDLSTAWLRDAIDNETPAPVLMYLFEETELGTFEAGQLDAYLQAVAAAPEDQRLDRMKDALPALDLLPDPGLLNSGVARSRIQQNLAVRELVLASPDSNAEIREIDKIKQAAAAGNVSAVALLAFSRNQTPESLKAADLEEVREILRRPKRPPKGRSTRALDLYDLLNNEDGKIANADIRTALTSLGDAWKLDGGNEQTLTTSVAVEDRHLDVKVDVKAFCEPGESAWFDTGLQPHQGREAWLAFSSASRTDLDWTSGNGLSALIDAERLLEEARGQDDIEELGGGFEDLVQEYLDARAALLPYERWLAHSVQELLLLDETARTAVRSFLLSWQTLVDAALNVKSDVPAPLNPWLTLLETLSVPGPGSPEQLVAASLGPFHPYALGPRLRIADYAVTGVGQAGLGDRLLWALDRSVPAYPVITLLQNRLYYQSSAGAVVRFDETPQKQAPPARTGGGLFEIALSYVGYHPYLQGESEIAEPSGHLVLLLVDPPLGGGVQRDVQRLTNLLDGNLRVYVLTTRAGSARLEDVDDVVVSLGHYDSLEDWTRRNDLKVHISFIFVEAPPGHAASSAAGMGPPPGAGVAPVIRVTPPGPTEPKTQELIPWVSFAPMEENRAVISLTALSTDRQEAAKIFEVRPVIEDVLGTRAGALVDVTDWIVIGAPTPLGVVAPRQVGGDYTYLGREALGPYGLFAYARSLFSLRRRIQSYLKAVPVFPAEDVVESRIEALAAESKNGLLRMGKAQAVGFWEQVGVMMATDVGRGL